MSKIILCKLSKKSNYKKIENVEESIEEKIEEKIQENKIIVNKTNVNKNNNSEKKSYLQLLEKIKTSIADSKTDDSKTNITDISATIISMYDNYEEQLLCLHKLLNGVVFDEKKYFIQALKNKLDSYKQQDKKKTYDAYNNFITLENIIEKLVACNMRCYYCNSKTLILFKNVRTNYQWTLDRLNNYDEHSNANTIICCLKCNLQRRRKNSEKFKFTKQLEHNLLLLKKID
jgi:MFS superfamily sulfate permease-like transporter